MTQSLTSLSPRVQALSELLSQQYRLQTQQALPAKLLEQTLAPIEAALQQQANKVVELATGLLPAAKANPKAMLQVQETAKGILLGKGEPSGWLVHVLAWQYLPAALLTPVVTRWTLNQRPDVNSPANRREQTRAEIWRQVTSGSIHVANAYLGGLAFKGVVALTHQHHHLSRWGGQVKGVPLLSPALLASGQWLKQWGQHLVGSTQQTAGTLAFMIAGSTLGYGVLRPYISMSAYTHDKERDMLALGPPAQVTFKDATVSNPLTEWKA